MASQFESLEQTVNARMGQMNQDANAVAGPVPPGINEASLETMKALAEHMGAIAAMRRRQSGLQLDPSEMGAVVSGTQPGVPQAQMLAPVPNPAPREMAVGGNYAERERFNKNQVIGMLHDMTTKAEAGHKQKEMVMAQREYQILMTAMAALQQDPSNEHNRNIVNSFFEDQAKVKRLKNVFGFDAFDPKKEAKKQGDPNYQAFNSALTDFEKQNTVQTPNGVPVPMSAMQPQQKQGPEYLKGLSPAAQQFFGQFPETAYNEFVPSAKAKAFEYGIKNKLIPEASDVMKNDTELLKQGTEVGKAIMNDLTQLNVAEIQTRGKKYGDFLQGKVQLELGVLDWMKNQAQLRIKELELAQGKETNLMASQKMILDAYQIIYKGTEAQIEQIDQMYFKNKSWADTHVKKPWFGAPELTEEGKKITAVREALVKQLTTDRANIEQSARNLTQFGGDRYGLNTTGLTGTIADLVSKAGQREVPNQQRPTGNSSSNNSGTGAGGDNVRSSAAGSSVSLQYSGPTAGTDPNLQNFLDQLNRVKK